jgi:hypothetical protein
LLRAPAEIQFRMLFCVATGWFRCPSASFSTSTLLSGMNGTTLMVKPLIGEFAGTLTRLEKDCPELRFIPAAGLLPPWQPEQIGVKTLVCRKVSVMAGGWVGVAVGVTVGVRVGVGVAVGGAVVGV